MKAKAKKNEIISKRVTATIERLLAHAAADIRKGRKFWFNLADDRADLRKGARELRQI